MWRALCGGHYIEGTMQFYSHKSAQLGSKELVHLSLHGNYQSSVHYSQIICIWLDSIDLPTSCSCIITHHARIYTCGKHPCQTGQRPIFVINQLAIMLNSYYYVTNAFHGPADIYIYTYTH